MGQIQSMVEDHQKEIRRRREGYDEHMRQRGEGCEPTGFGDGGGATNDPFVDPSQVFVVFNLSHAHIPPRTPNGSDPGLRLCGAFATQDEAIHHARGLATTDPDCSVLLAPMRDWVLMASTPEMLADAELTADIKRERMEAYQNTLLKNKSDFERRCSESLDEGGSETEKSITEEARAQEASAQEASAQEASAQEASGDDHHHREYMNSFPRNEEVRDQAVAVVSFLPDISGSNPAHTMFCVWRVFGTEAEAENWILNVAGNHVRDFSFDTVSLYEWLKPQSVSVSDIRKVTYRNKEQSNIMTFASNQQAAIDSFKRECEQTGCETPYISL